MSDLRPRNVVAKPSSTPTPSPKRWCRSYHPREYNGATPSSSSSSSSARNSININDNDNANGRWMGCSRMKRNHVVLWFVILFAFLHLRNEYPPPDITDTAAVVLKTKTKTNTNANANANANANTNTKKTKPNSKSNNSNSDNDNNNDNNNSKVRTRDWSSSSSTSTSITISKDDSQSPTTLPLPQAVQKKTKPPRTGKQKANTKTAGDENENDNDNETKTNPPVANDNDNDNDNANSNDDENSKTDVKGRNKSRDEFDANASANANGDGIATIPPPPSSSSEQAPGSSPTKSTNKRSTPKPDTNKSGSSTATTTSPLPSPNSKQQQQHPQKSDADLSPTALKFVETHCDLAHVKDGEWYPSGEENEWKQRAPYLIVAGVWNAGVNPLAGALLKHPQIEAAKQYGFFLPKQFQKYTDNVPTASAATTAAANDNDNDNDNNNNNNSVAATTTAAGVSAGKFNVKVFAARERMYAQVYSKSSFQGKIGTGDEKSTPTANDATSDATANDNNNNNNNNNNINNNNINKHVAMDVSPGLIFYAHKTAHAVLCTAPWVKVVVVLRNPIDRLYQQWVYSTIHLGLKLSLEDWMAQEMKLMQSVGLISTNGSSSSSGSGSGSGSGGTSEAANKGTTATTTDGKDKATGAVVSEKEAWGKYQSVHNMAGAIGRSLYVFQLEEWIEAYVSAGKNPSKEIIVLTTEEIEEDPVHQYAELIRVLGLSPLDENNNNNNNNDAVSDDGADGVATALQKSLLQRNNNDSTLDPMKEETRNMLKQFFKPYNKRLTKLLRSNGFEGNWNKLWNN